MLKRHASILMIAFFLGSTSSVAQEWQEKSAEGAPVPAEASSTVWTGHEFIVWGGRIDDDYVQTGRRYELKNDRWLSVSLDGAPSPRAWHSAVWTGSEMIIWGGDNKEIELGDGAAYDPETDSWRTLSSTDAPAARGSHVSVWTGKEMIVWAGVTEENSFSDGGRYDPKSDEWTAIKCPIEQMLPRSTTAIWTGKEMIVWGGINGSWVLDHGTRYDVGNDTWSFISADEGLPARTGHAAVWTGDKMIVWGGRNNYSAGGPLADGASYDPQDKAWHPLPAGENIESRDEPVFTWTGSELVVMGGRTDRKTNRFGGNAYNPTTKRWRNLETPHAQLQSCVSANQALLALGVKDGEKSLRVWRTTWHEH